MSRKRILWLASWYPNRYDQFNGDFIQRHAQAASIDNDIFVIYLQDATDIAGTEEHININGGLTEQIVYYKKGSGLLGKLLKQINYFSVYTNAIKSYIRKYGLPHCVHVHVPWKAGLLALWMKRVYGVQFYVTEHWGIYNDKVVGNIFTKPFYVRKLIELIIHKSVKLITVSNFIGHGINKIITRKEFEFVPNVVNTNFFKYSSQKHQKFTFLHVSNMVELKNVDDILLAFCNFIIQEKVDVRLVLIGNTDDFYKSKAREIGVPEQSIMFKGVMTYEKVAQEMQQSHCLVLNSIMENSPCVIGEALCCGVPVIATKVGGIPELVADKDGILIDPLNVKELVSAMKEMYFNYVSFNSKYISEKSKRKFNYEVIAHQFNNIYTQSSH